ncbi:MAG: nucleotidyltransferase family protein [Thermomicrobiales bacterium]
MIELLEKHRTPIDDLCEKAGVQRLEIFGSAATGSFDPANSDIDFIVDFADCSPGYARRFFALEAALASLLGTEVDLLTERSIENPYFKASVDESRVTIYEARVRQTAA